MPSTIRSTFALLGTLGCAIAPNGPSPASPRTLLGEVDTIAEVDRGSPYGAAVSRDGLALVTLHGQTAALAAWTFGKREFRPTAFPTGQEPTNVAFSPDGRTAYVASQLSYRVDRIDLRRERVDSLWHTPANDPFQVAASPDGKWVIATGNAGYVYIFDASSGRPKGAVEVRGAPNGIAISPDGRTAYVTHLRSREIGVVDLVHASYRTFALLDAVEGQGIVLSPDGGTLYAVSERADRLYAFDTFTGRTLGTVPTGGRPFGLALTPDGRELWITTLSGDLVRVRRTDLSTVAVNHLGGRLRRLAVDPAGRGAVVADEEGRVIILK
ncbi:MAG TPA: YncE family protein [Gemmatimonadales bacterium]|nr:YncE family protein [Gemmatimonadales bacterium]